MSPEFHENENPFDILKLLDSRLRGNDFQQPVVAVRLLLFPVRLQFGMRCPLLGVQATG